MLNYMRPRHNLSIWNDVEAKYNIYFKTTWLS